jgi:hypothetical protein
VHSSADDANIYGVHGTSSRGVCKYLEEPPQECMLRDLSNYTECSEEGRRIKDQNGADCLRFQCMSNITKCDNPLATILTAQTLRARISSETREFDRVMCYLGLEYLPAFGMLLGLARSVDSLD